jgi:hypothetical protein
MSFNGVSRLDRGGWVSKGEVWDGEVVESIVTDLGRQAKLLRHTARSVK